MRDVTLMNADEPPTHAPDNLLALGAAGSVYSTFGSPRVPFDGFSFLQSSAMIAPFLHLAYHARRGDVIAQALLDGFKVKIEDADGKSYWPM